VGIISIRHTPPVCLSEDLLRHLQVHAQVRQIDELRDRHVSGDARQQRIDVNPLFLVNDDAPVRDRNKLGVLVDGLVGVPDSHLDLVNTGPISLTVDNREIVGRGREPKMTLESYSPEQLEALRLANLLVHARDREITRTLVMLLESLLARCQSRARR